mmetsp:Transcript_143220/g.260459  ORF Transcript_143220/g.260459 Transcript_143220/m.260459 type:complete len:363 (-) Transcript_143220:161-1249(-)
MVASASNLALLSSSACRGKLSRARFISVSSVTPAFFLVRSLLRSRSSPGMDIFLTDVSYSLAKFRSSCRVESWPLSKASLNLVSIRSLTCLRFFIRRSLVESSPASSFFSPSNAPPHGAMSFSILFNLDRLTPPSSASSASRLSSLPGSTSRLRVAMDSFSLGSSFSQGAPPSFATSAACLSRLAAISSNLFRELAPLSKERLTTSRIFLDNVLACCKKTGTSSRTSVMNSLAFCRNCSTFLQESSSWSGGAVANTELASVRYSVAMAFCRLLCLSWTSADAFRTSSSCFEILTTSWMRARLAVRNKLISTSSTSSEVKVSATRCICASAFLSLPPRSFVKNSLTSIKFAMHLSNSESPPMP